MADDEPIHLVFKGNVRVSGELLHGEVHLNFPVLLKSKVEEVHVKLRGAITTSIERSSGNDNSRRQTQRIELARETISLWEQGKAYPPPDSHILVLPFQFVLPARALPSCTHTAIYNKGTVEYFVEVVGRRPGIHLDKRYVVPFSVLPPNPAGAQLRAALAAGWQGQWRSVEREQDVRRGIWGEYSHVKMTLLIPAIEQFPLLTKIPITLNIVTTTKPMKRDDSTSDEIFPAPPTMPEDIEFYLDRDVHVAAHNWTSSSHSNFVCHLGGFGSGSSVTKAKDVDVQVMDKVWIPTFGDEKKHKGSWKQEVTFRSHIYLNCPPTFQCQLMSFTYWMRLKIDFQGIGNSLKAEFPALLCSSALSSGTEASAGWDGPPPETDLPPDYSLPSEWHADDKD